MRRKRPGGSVIQFLLVTLGSDTAASLRPSGDLSTSKIAGGPGMRRVSRPDGGA